MPHCNARCSGQALTLRRRAQADTCVHVTAGLVLFFDPIPIPDLSPIPDHTPTQMSTLPPCPYSVTSSAGLGRVDKRTESRTSSTRKGLPGERGRGVIRDERSGAERRGIPPENSALLSQAGLLRGKLAGRARATLGRHQNPGQVLFETSFTGKPPVLPTPSTRRMLGWRSEIMIWVGV